MNWIMDNSIGIGAKFTLRIQSVNAKYLLIRPNLNNAALQTVDAFIMLTTVTIDGMCLCRAAMIQITHAISAYQSKCEKFKWMNKWIVHKIEIHFTASTTRMLFSTRLFRSFLFHFITFWRKSSVWSVDTQAILYVHLFVCDLSAYTTW